MTFGLRESDRKYIDRVGVGSNPSEKLRSLFDRWAEKTDAIAGEPHAILIYEQNADGEKTWYDAETFGKNWRKIPEIATRKGFTSQVIEDQEAGTVEVWIAPVKNKKDCATCKAKILEVLNG
jgi:hypothetical protein